MPKLLPTGVYRGYEPGGALDVPGPGQVWFDKLAMSGNFPAGVRSFSPAFPAGGRFLVVAGRSAVPALCYAQIVTHI